MIDYNNTITDSAELILSEIHNPDVLKQFSQEELDLINNEVKEIHYEKGQKIIQEGSRPTGIYCITQGTAKLYKSGFNGKEQILRFMKKGEIIAYRSLLSDEDFASSCSALDGLAAVYVPEATFHKLLALSPTVSIELLKKLAIDLGNAEKTITLLAQKTVRERLAEILLWLESKLGVDENGFIKISLTREETANLVGTATESAIRLISEFKSDGFIEVIGRRIKLLDKPRLIRLGEGHVPI
ncbi:MAG: Crp/Fnr family transcriptional regulator [Flavobacteriaceae bacterium]|jgi:CRP-like cAMP-binding protein|nr:Crp/Fnr family transcriptional regulator [Flavobacteriaceae bacterium]